MKHCLLLLTLIGKSAFAFVTWPGAAPCDSTLQACIDASSDGEYIEIRTDGPINENIFTNTAVSLVAGNGFEPVFSTFNSIQINSFASTTVTVKGLTLERGRIMVRQFSNTGTINILNNNVMGNSNNASGIRVDNYSLNELNLNIKFNSVYVEISEELAIPTGAIMVYKPNTGDGDISGVIYNNAIQSVGIESKGIVVVDNSDNDMNMNIVGNEISGGTQGGVFAHKPSGNGTTTLDIVSNSFVQEGTFYFPSGVHVINDSGTTDASVINNTMIQSRYAVSLHENGGTLTADVFNNLAAHCIFGFAFHAAVDVNHDYNLYFDNEFNDNYTPGPNSINANPLLKTLKDPRLHSGSPAENSGNPFALFLVPGTTPLVDADGQHRIKTDGAGAAEIDIGAYERGDNYFIATHDFNNNHTTILDSPYLNGLSSLDSVHITSNFNPYSSAGVYNNDQEGIYYSSGYWRAFNQSLTTLSDGASFNVVKFGSTSNTFEHNVDTAGSNADTINDSGLDGNPDKILKVTQHWTGVYNPHPHGILYGFGQWAVMNFDLQNIPQNSNFNIYYQDASKSAWEHIAAPQNIDFNVTYLNNPLINGFQCAQLQVTQSASQGVFNDSPVGVYYDTSIDRWGIYNQDVTLMPTGAAFHVIVNPEQIFDCTDLIFKDGLD